jgi:signal peptidase I
MFGRKKKQKKDKKDMTLKERVIENINLFLSAYLIAFVIRLLILEAYQIPSQSMVPSLMVRDILMVEKVSYGTLIPIVNWKIPGFTSPKRNDIAVFVSPEWKSPGIGREIVSLLSLSIINLDNTFETPKNLVKRVVGEPGDVIFMTNQRLVINGEVLNADFIKSSEQVQYDGGKPMIRYINGRQQALTRRFDIFEETYSNTVRISQHISGLTEAYRLDEDMFYTPDFIHNFRDYRAMLVLGFPEIIVPKKDETIDLTEANYYFKYLMKMLIERETGKAVFVSTDGGLYLEGVELTGWTPAEDYYFAMGDNRDASEDCRYFGFIPRSKIFGRIFFRYFPFRRFGFRTDVNRDKVGKMIFN